MTAEPLIVGHVFNAWIVAFFVLVGVTCLVVGIVEAVRRPPGNRRRKRKDYITWDP